MSRRATAILVAVAVAAGIGLAAYGLATKGSSKQARVLQIDEVTGRVGAIVLGETRQNVIGAMGRPTFAKNLPGPTSSVHLGVLLYPRLEINLRNNAVVSIRTDDPAARTDQAVRIGEPISSVRASYRQAARCIPNAPDKQDPHPRCTVKVPAGRLLVRGDPIEKLTLVRTR